MKSYMNHTHAQAHTQLHAHTEEVRETQRDGHNMHTHIKYKNNPQMTVVIQFSIPKKERLLSF